jgi:hypothetical protein
MKSRRPIHPIALFQKAQPPSRFFWVGLIFCLPWIVGAQEKPSEPAAASPTEQKVAIDQPKPAAPLESVAPAAESLANIVQEPVKTSEPAPTPPAIVAEPAPALPVIVAEPPQKAPETTVKANHIEKAPPVCRMPNPAEPPSYRSTAISTIGMAPLSHGNLELDFLYWKATADTLRFAMTNNTATSPTSFMIEQKFGYNPGVRAALVVPILYDEWEMATTYTRFYSTSPAKHISDPEGDLFPTLDYVGWVTSPTSTGAFAAKAKWTLKINAIDFEFRRPFVLGKSLMLQPLMGVKAASVQQLWHVFYTPTPAAIVSNQPSRNITMRSNVWAVGPKFGVAMRFLIPKQISLSIASDVSLMVGYMSGRSKYAEQAGLPFNLTIFKNKKTRVYEMQRIECAFSKWWSIKNDSSLELTAGWEVQYWWHQLRTNWYSTITNPNGGADLTLQGPFMRGSWNF